jgi:hypothetical protein
MSGTEFLEIVRVLGIFFFYIISVGLCIKILEWISK